MARLDKLTPKIHKLILQAIKAGLSYAKASDLAGISSVTLWEWRKRGEREKSGKFFKFSNDIKRAEAEGVKKNLAIIKQAAKGGAKVTETKEKYGVNGNLEEKVTIVKKALPQWQAAAWILERRHPDEFARDRQQDSEDVYENDGFEEAMSEATRKAFS